MISLDGCLVFVVTKGAAWVLPHVDALQGAGARVRACAPDRDLWSTLSASDCAAIVVADVEPSVKALARALAEDAQLRSVPAMVLVPPGALVQAPEGESAMNLAVADGAAPQKTAATLAALLAAHPPPRRQGSAIQAGTVPPPDSPARQELEKGFHDLRVLLGVILGYGANLRDGADGALTEAQRSAVLKIVETAADATALVERTMAATRTASLGVPTAPPPGTQRTLADITAIAESVVRLFGKSAAQRAVDLQCVSAEPIGVWGNAVHFKQIVTNLVVNALKFTPPGGRVRVSTRVSAPGDAEIVVSDTGPGVPEEDRERIFEQGVRLARDAGVVGAGIGLAVVRELVVVHHGGSVRVVEAKGGGAEFIVTVPLDRRLRARELAERQAQATRAQPPTGGTS